MRAKVVKFLPLAALLCVSCSPQRPSAKLVPPPPATPAVVPQPVPKAAVPVKRIDPAEQQAIATYRRTGKEVVNTVGDVTRVVFTGKTVKVFCRPLFMTDIELQDGEQFISSVLGDEKLWNPAVIAQAGGRFHVSTKPLSDTPGIETSLTVYTDKRTYHFLLQSNAKRYMGRVTFYYPEAEEPKQMGKEFAR